MFQMAHPVNGVLTSDAARNIFMKSNLSVDQLAQIWNLADTRRSGTLNQTEFIIAMHYIAGTMDGSVGTLPSSLPPHIYKSAAGSPAPTSPIARHFSGESSLSPSFMQRFPMNSPSFQKQTPTRQFTGSPLQSQVNISTSSSLAASNTDHSHWDVTEQERQKYDTYFDRIDSNRTGVIQGTFSVWLS
jgi:epidermal growth factor receptor substrate 15